MSYRRYTIEVWAWRDNDPEQDLADWFNVYERFANSRSEAEVIGEELADRDLVGDWQQIESRAYAA